MTQSPLVRAYLRHNGCPEDLVTAIDPADEMLRTILRHDRTGFRAEVEYFRSGLEAARLVGHAAAVTGRPLRAREAVLDFASGWGRVTRHLAARTGRQRVFASDIADDAVRFVGNTLGVHAFASHLDPDELEMPRPFDLVFVGSLFTHLPYERFVAWLRRLADALTPDGILVFSTHGLRVAPNVAKHPSGFTFHRATPIDYLPVEEYASTYVTHDVVRRIATEVGLAPPTVLPETLWQVQDLWVASRSPDRVPDPLPPPALAVGRIERVCFPRPDWVWLSGFVAVHASHVPLREVRLVVDGTDVGPARLAEPRATDNRGADAGDLRYTDFYVEGPRSAAPEDAHTIAAVATTARGERQCFDVVPFGF